MKYQILTLFFLSVLIAQARDGNDVGNGGDAVVCFGSAETRDYVDEVLHKNRERSNPLPVFEEQTVRDAIVSVQSFDYFQYTRPQGYPPVSRNTIDNQADALKVVELTLERLKGKSNFETTLRKQAQLYPLSTWQAAPGLPEVDDSGHTAYVPRNCLLVQIAVRNNERVYFDEYLFGRMDSLNQASLILHEWAYAFVIYSLNASENNLSAKAREMVGLLISKDEFDSLTQLQLKDRLSKWGLRDARMAPVELTTETTRFRVEPISLYDDGAIRTAIGISGEATFWGELRVPVKELYLDFFPSGKIQKVYRNASFPTYYECSKIRLSVDGPAYDVSRCPYEFYETGVPFSLSVTGEQELKFPKLFTVALEKRSLEVFFHPNGAVQKADFTYSSSAQVNYRGSWITLKGFEVQWHDNQMLKTFVPIRNLVVSQYVTCEGAAWVSIYPDGRLAACILNKDTKIAVGGQVVELVGSWREFPIEFHSNGALKYGVVPDKQKFKVWGHVLELAGGAEFDSSGALLYAQLNQHKVITITRKGVRINLQFQLRWDDKGHICAGRVADESLIFENQVYTRGEEINLGCKLGRDAVRRFQHDGM